MILDVFFNRIECDQCNSVALNTFVNCEAILTGRVMMSPLWSKPIPSCGATMFGKYLRTFDGRGEDRIKKLKLHF